MYVAYNRLWFLVHTKTWISQWFQNDFKNAKVKFIHTVPLNTIKIFKSFSGQDQSNQAFRFLKIFMRSEILLVKIKYAKVKAVRFFCNLSQKFIPTNFALLIIMYFYNCIFMTKWNWLVFREVFKHGSRRIAHAAISQWWSVK